MLKKNDWIALLLLGFLGVLGWLALHPGILSLRPGPTHGQMQRHL